MAIEKMVLLNLVGSLEEEHAILEQLVLCDNVHLNLDHQGDVYDNNYIVHEYEAMIPHNTLVLEENYQELEANYSEMENMLYEVSNGLGMRELITTQKYDRAYTIQEAKKSLDDLKDEIGESVLEINHRKHQIKQLEGFRYIASNIKKKNLSFLPLKEMNYFDYEIGLLSHENKVQIKKNYENISAIVLQIGEMQDSREDIYLVLYPRQFREETDKLLKSLNWVQIKIPEGISQDVNDMVRSVDSKIETLKQDIEELMCIILKDKEQKLELLNKIYTRIKLEQKILEMKEQIIHGNNLFVLNAWITKKDKERVEEEIGNVTDKFVIIIKDADELGKQVIPPTKLKNNWLVRPFETVVRLYGLPSYHEIDPTPFLAITFCLMFGIMFGDIGQGLVYFLAGVFMYKKNAVVGGVLTRLGSFSILFGFVYGSLFGLEQHELPWLPSLIGSPLSTRNIPVILISGVVFGVVVLTISFIFGITNALRRKDIEEGIFGKNGLVGYIFFMGLIFTGVTLVGVIPVPVFVPVIVMVIALIVMVFKEPLTNMVLKNKTLIHGDATSYFVESGFEGVETILGALSNAISFIRVGAFALNHAGLFMAFLVMSDMTDNIILKIIILILGNILILTLEGLVVFIQGLRLQYYEMFSKYFKGDGVEYNPISIQNK
ncbi:MAG: V-type ATP synthase subunit I [Cellulosilyticaceae bacterium]